MPYIPFYLFSITKTNKNKNKQKRSVCLTLTTTATTAIWCELNLIAIYWFIAGVSYGRNGEFRQAISNMEDWHWLYQLDWNISASQGGPSTGVKNLFLFDNLFQIGHLAPAINFTVFSQKVPWNTDNELFIVSP